MSSRDFSKFIYKALLLKKPKQRTSKPRGFFVELYIDHRLFVMYD